MGGGQTRNAALTTTDSDFSCRNVFFGCSMRGGYSFVTREDLAHIPRIIKELGHHLMSDHQTREGFSEIESGLTVAEIHDRDYRWLTDADVGIFEISNPSLGVGGEIADMINLGKPVLILMRQDLQESVSAYILGKVGSEYIESSVESYAYEGLDDLKEKIAEFITVRRICGEHSVQ